MFFHPVNALRRAAASLRNVSRAAVQRRMAGLMLALVAEVFLALLLLTLSYPSRPGRERDERSLSTFTVAPAAQPADEQAPAPERSDRPAEARPAERPQQATPEVRQPAPMPEQAPPPPFISIAPGQLSSTDLASVPRAAPAPRRSVAGPPNTGGGPPDTPRVVGAGPNGEPLYAAAWYREPYDSELRGYLSTAQGPGWALIACRTVREWRVEDCVAMDEYPERSGIARAVLAAAWQFKVRPPMLRGQYRVGEWVRIRIDYERR